MQKTSIIGAGISGLVTACCLARKGHDVTIFEKNDTIGGRARAYSAEGFFFDMGPSWYWMPDIFESFFNLFGKSVSDYYELVKLDPGFRIFFKEGQPMDIPADPDLLGDMLENIESGSKAKLQSYLTDAAYKYYEGMLKLAFKPSKSIAEYIDIGLLSKLFSLKMLTSSKKHIRNHFKDPRIIALMEFPLLFLGAKPANIPSLYSLMNFAALQQGTWYPMGGMYKIIEAMETLALSLGVKIHTGQTVDKIIIKNRKALGIGIDGRIIHADTLVASGDYAHIETLLEPEFRNYTEQYWDKRTFAPSCLIFYLGVNKKIKGLQHHNLFFDADFDQHSEQIYTKPEWPADPLFYVCCPTKTDDSVAPAGCENLFVLMPIATGLEDTPETHEFYFDKLIARIEQKCGEPIKQNIIYRRTYSGKDFSNDYNAYGGNAYGLANTLMQTAFLKPSITNKKIDNLFYTGQLTVPGPGLPPCIISGQIAAQLVLDQQ